MSSETTTRVLDPGVVADADHTRVWGWVPVVEHHILRMRSYVRTMLITGIGSPVVYLAGLGAGLGVLVDQGKGIDGVPYLTFIAPALVLAMAMQVSSQENTYGTFGGFRWSNIYNAMRLTPISPAQMAVGSQVAVLARVLPLLAFYLVALGLFGIGTPLRLLAMVPLGMLMSVSFGFAVQAWVATQKDDRGQMSFVERFVVVPLTLFSGTYFPLDTLPGYLQPIGWVSPLWHATELGRWILYGQETAVVVHLTFLVALAIVGGVLAVRHFRWRLDE